jgi:Domain of unknown function (DUF5122) beta-propeller
MSKRLRALLALAVASAGLAMPQLARGDALVTHDRVVSADPAATTPHVLNGRVYAIVQIGDTVYVGGSFTKVQAPEGGQIRYRQRLFAFDATTGAISSTWKPRANDSVYSLVADGTSIWAGGAFTSINDVPAPRLAKLDSSGTLDPAFAGGVSAGTRVNDLALSGSVLIAAGQFTHINGASSPGLARLDPATGEEVPGSTPRFEGTHNGGTSHVARIDVTPDGSTLVAIGNFTTVDGQDRRQIAIVDLEPDTSTVSSWQTTRFAGQCSSTFETYLRDVSISPDGSYFVVVTTGAFRGGVLAGVLCDTATRWELGPTGSGQQPTWVDYAGGDTTWRVLVTGSAVYVGGHFRWWNSPYVGDAVGPGAVKRNGIAALDPINGLPIAWNPGRKKGEGVFAFLATDQGLWVGSDTDEIGGEVHARLAFFPLDGGTVIPTHEPPTLPGTLYTLPPLDTPSPAYQVTRRSFDGSVTGAPSVATTVIDWSHASGAFAVGDRVYAGWDDGRIYHWRSGVSTFSGKKVVYLRGLTDAHFPLASVSGMFLEHGRLYYTVAGDDRLFMRYFTPSSGVVGAVTFVIDGPNTGFDWGSVRGMTLAGGSVYVGRADGRLDRIGWLDGDPVPASLELVDAGAGQDWSSAGMWLRNG